MQLLDRRLLFVTGKGGVGKTSVASGLALLAANEGKRVLLCDVDGSGERLAFGSTTGALWVSENGGDSWTRVSAHLPPIYSVRFSRA